MPGAACRRLEGGRRPGEETAADCGVTTDRWRRIEELFLEVLAHPPDEREAALAAACHGDVGLQAEVQSLLDQPESSEFLGTPAREIAARLMSQPASSTLAGRRMGVFELQGLLGVGGMGEVHRARDTRLGRDVAIKVLSPAFTNHPDRLARFEREARILASLNHPHIGVIYSLEESDGLRALVLEVVEGEDLSQRIARGPMLDQRSARDRQADRRSPGSRARARHHPPRFEAREHQGPSRRCGEGARLWAGQSGQGRAPGPDLSQCPSDEGSTREGAVFGTAAYMSPEQARGKPVSKRSDIWAFGCVLFEMLTGTRAFEATGMSNTIAVVLTAEPDWTRLGRQTPEPILTLLERCLEKDPFATIARHRRRAYRARCGR